MHGRNAQAERLDQRPEKAHDEEDDAANKHHVNTGDRQQVREAAKAQRLGVVGGDKAAVARHHGG